MALTLLESAKYAKDSMTKAITELIAERSPILTYLPFETVDSGTFTFTREVALPGFAFRGVNETYPRSTGVIQDVSEAVKIMGGEVFIDRFQLKMHSNKRDLKARQWAMKTKAIKMGFSEYFFEGDSAANPRVFDGMRNRLTGTQVQETATNGAALDLDMLDELIDSVIGEGDGAHLFLNKTLRRKITNLGRNTAGTFPLIDVGDDEFGHQVTRYNGVPGATDGTFLHTRAGIPIVTTGAGNREMPHHKDEWVSEEELFATCRLYAATAMYYAYGEEADV